MGVVESANKALKLSMTAACGLNLLTAPKSEAGLMVSMKREHYAKHELLANNARFQFATYVEVTTPSGSKATSSGIAIAPNVILVSAHGIPSATNAAVVSSVTMGSNIFASDAVKFTVKKWERFPGYISGNKNTLDFGLVYLNENIPGFTPVSFGSVTIGQNPILVEYGNIAEQNGSATYPTLGDRLAGYTPVVNDSGILGYPQSSYFTTEFALGLPADCLNVLGLAGSSGGALFNDLGQIVGIQTAASNGMWGGYSAAMRTDNQDFLSYVTPRIQASWASIEPTLTPSMENGAFKVSWSPSAIGWTLQTSTDMKNWTNVEPAITEAGSIVLSTHGKPRQWARLMKP